MRPLIIIGATLALVLGTGYLVAAYNVFGAMTDALRQIEIKRADAE